MLNHAQKKLKSWQLYVAIYLRMKILQKNHNSCSISVHSCLEVCNLDFPIEFHTRYRSVIFFNKKSEKIQGPIADVKALYKDNTVHKTQTEDEQSENTENKATLTRPDSDK